MMVHDPVTEGMYRTSTGGDELARLPVTVAVGDVLKALSDAGAVIIDEFVKPDQLTRLNSELDGWVAAASTGSRSGDRVWERFHGGNTKRFTRLVSRCPTFPELLQHRLFREVADALLLPSCGGYWLNTAQMMVVGPGEAPQALHRDQDNWPLFSSAFGASGPEVTVSVLIALSRFATENGATRVIPGSHRWADFTEPGSPQLTIAAEMEPGSALLYTGRVMHGAGGNTTADEWRRGLHVSFVLGWLTPEEANPLASPLEAVTTLPEDVQRLLGWGSYDPAPHRGGRLWTIDFDDMRTTLVPELRVAMSGESRSM